jgi:hypothetical protein
LYAHHVAILALTVPTDKLVLPALLDLLYMKESAMITAHLEQLMLTTFAKTALTKDVQNATLLI